MEESYLDRLPADLTYLLALKLPWSELYSAYCHLAAFRRYDDPQHRLWVELYHRDLSSYTLTAATYREQYFWGHHLCESLHQQCLSKQGLTLASLGYDRVLYQIPLRGKWIFEATKGAIEKGYLTIVDLMVPHVEPVNLPSLIRLADRGGFTELTDELRSLYAHHFPARYLRVYGPARLRP